MPLPPPHKGARRKDAEAVVSHLVIGHDRAGVARGQSSVQPVQVVVLLAGGGEQHALRPPLLDERLVCCRPAGGVLLMKDHQYPLRRTPRPRPLHRAEHRLHVRKIEHLLPISLRSGSIRLLPGEAGLLRKCHRVGPAAGAGSRRGRPNAPLSRPAHALLRQLTAAGRSLRRHTALRPLLRPVPLLQLGLRTHKVELLALPKEADIGTIQHKVPRPLLRHPPREGGEVLCATRQTLHRGAQLPLTEQRPVWSTCAGKTRQPQVGRVGGAPGDWTTPPPARTDATPNPCSLGPPLAPCAGSLPPPSAPFAPSDAASTPSPAAPLSTAALSSPSPASVTADTSPIIHRSTASTALPSPLTACRRISCKYSASPSGTPATASRAHALSPSAASPLSAAAASSGVTVRSLTRPHPPAAISSSTASAYSSSPAAQSTRIATPAARAASQIRLASVARGGSQAPHRWSKTEQSESCGATPAAFMRSKTASAPAASDRAAHACSSFTCCFRADADDCAAPGAPAAAVAARALAAAAGPQSSSSGGESALRLRLAPGHSGESAAARGESGLSVTTTDVWIRLPTSFTTLRASSPSRSQ
eukprot:scaffold5469_cov91-Isochrysis_galbana.AAC.3